MSMGVKVTTTCLQWSAHHSIIPHSPSSSQTLASSDRRRTKRGDASSAGKFLTCNYAPPQRINRTVFLGTQSSELHRSTSFDPLEFSKATTLQNRIRRACSASFDSFSDEEFSVEIHQLALKCRTSDDEDDERRARGNRSEAEIIHESTDNHGIDNYGYSNVEIVQESNSCFDSIEPLWREMESDLSIERKANSLPFSLRIIKRKLQWEEGFREASESAYCSVKSAFSSMVFMIEEMHSFTLQMREPLFSEDLQGVLQRMQKEMKASFVWLFQRVFSQTPTVMVYVMILLADFIVHSIGTNGAMAAAAALPPASSQRTSFVLEIRDQMYETFDPSSVKRFRISSKGGKTASIGDDHGGDGGKVRPVASGTNGKSLDGSNRFRRIVPDSISRLSLFDSSERLEGSVSVWGQVSREQEEIDLWNSIVDEAEGLQDPSVDQETRQKFVSLVDVTIVPDDYADYFRTELLYQTGLAQEPNNTLLVANYAQLLYLVGQDYDRAEKYFKRAVGTEPVDPDAYSKYANFLWRVRNDLWAAEEKFLEAISADPANSYYAANYANFLWNTGGDDTCFLLDSTETYEEFA